jgi:hypothetical protein
MLDLRLRDEFKGKRLRGTTVDFTNQSKTGALEVPAAEFLKITYPSFDLLKTVEATSPGHSRPVVLLGARGQGKSHLLAALYHLCMDASTGQKWLSDWSGQLSRPDMAALKLRTGCCVIAESLHLQRFRFLWDILFERHPEGKYFKGKWEGLGDKKTDVPSDLLLIEMFKRQPAVVILDEFQTWFEGQTNTKQYPWRTWAFNFIQILSEISQKSPELLVLVASVREGNSDAAQQIFRVNPVIVDFQGPMAKRDRQRLLLHRIFENRSQVPTAKIHGLIHTHVQECFRLAKVPQPEHERRLDDFLEAWPFAPHLLKLLDDQVLIAADAQETRDLIKILVDVFKQSGETQPLLTAADFSLTNEKSGVASLLDSVANQLHKDLRQKALRNLEAVRDAVPNADKAVPHLEEIVSALWLRSLTLDKVAGADPADLQIDITRSKPVDDNQFEAELATVEESSFNIHRIGNRLVFKHDENLRTKLLAHAKNDKLFQKTEDIDHLAKEVRSVISGPEHVSQNYRVVVLKRRWASDPWSEFEEKNRPKAWDNRLPMVVVPEYPDRLETALGQWLKDHLQDGRNTIRFLLPQKGMTSLYYDRELLVLARAVYLAMQWRKEEPAYADLQKKFQVELTAKLKGRFDRFAVLDVWNFAEAAKCRFQEQQHNVQGDKIPDAVDKIIKQSVFIPEEFEDYVRLLADNSESVGKLLKDLREPRPQGKRCVPWLGEVEVKERVTQMCAAGQIAINLRGLELLQARPGESYEDAWHRMKGKLGTGRHLDETTLHRPGAVVASGGKIPVTVPGPTVGGLVPGVTGGAVVPGTAVNPGVMVNPGLVIPGTTGDGGVGVGNLFGGSTGLATPPKEAHSASPTSGLNLLGQVESWGIGPATPVTNVVLRVGEMTGAQLQQLLKDLPAGVTYGLELEKEGS